MRDLSFRSERPLTLAARSRGRTRTVVRGKRPRDRTGRGPSDSHPAILEKTGGGDGFLTYVVMAPDQHVGLFVAFNNDLVAALNPLNRQTCRARPALRAASGLAASQGTRSCRRAAGPRQDSMQGRRLRGPISTRSARRGTKNAKARLEARGQFVSLAPRSGERSDEGDQPSAG